MKIRYLFFGLVFFLGCKTSNNVLLNEDSIKIIDTKFYSIKHPSSWRTYDKIHGGNKSKSSLVIVKSKKVFLTLELDIFSTKLELKNVIDDVISNNLFLKNAKIVSKTIKPDFLEVISLKKNGKKKNITRYYKKGENISQITFTTDEKNFENLKKFQNLFFNSFKIKE